MPQKQPEWTSKRKVKKGCTEQEILNTLLSERGLTTKEERDDFLLADYNKHLSDPFLFADMQKIIDRLTQAKERGEIVGIFGDHDADGVCAAALMADCLETCGIGTHVIIPSKKDGHGLTTAAIDIFKKHNILLVVTVDCGSANKEEITYAKNSDIDIIVTDHHQAPDSLSHAYGFINPQKEKDYPFKGLCGTGVVFKIAQALYSKINPQEISQLKWWLDIVAIATVADCMDLINENRVFVKYGLVVLEKTKRPGLQELLSVGEVGKFDTGGLSAQSIAFGVGPRLNAPGRMSHAMEAYELLRESDPALARVRATEIEELNNARRSETERHMRSVEKIIKKEFLQRHFLFIVDPGIPLGLLGIIAGRLAHKYKKPTGIFTSEGNIIRGSFRSANEVNIYELLTQAADHIEQFGGHAAAAGATLQKEKAEEFRAKMEVLVSRESHEPKEEVESDIQIDACLISDKLCDHISTLAPYGMGNPEPLWWLTGLHVSEYRPVGKTGKHAKMTLKTSEGKQIQGIGFGKAASVEEILANNLSAEIEIQATLQKNIWNGVTSTQLNITEIRKKV